jgi:leucyl aminopeptidase
VGVVGLSIEKMIGILQRFCKTPAFKNTRNFSTSIVPRLQINVVPSVVAAKQICPILVEFTTEENAKELQLIWTKAISHDFKGEKGQSLVYYSSGESNPSRHMWLGLGKQESADLNTIRKVSSKAVDMLSELKIQEAVFSLDLEYLKSINSQLSEASVVSTIANTLVQANYFFDKYITKPDLIKKKLEKAIFAVKHTNLDMQALTTALNVGVTFGEATNTARDLANERPDICNPAWMEAKALELVNQYKNDNLFDIEILSFSDMKKLGLNMFAAVGQGSSVPPRLVILKYRGDPGNDKNEIALIGKGITFDTGGLNLKPTGSIEDMFLDMSGSAAVYSVMSALPKLGIKKNIVGALCMAENAISKHAYYPSSIIKSYKGLTVEIGNTDAEGRLVLGDSMSYVQKKYSPEYMVDLATLTGACVVALGEFASGLFTNDKKLQDDLVASGESVFERTWPLPLYPEYTEELKGRQSDLRNIGKGRWAGACTGAAFLQEFVEKPVKWAHLDIAGPGMTSEKRGHIPKGGTGYGVQLLLNWIRNL